MNRQIQSLAILALLANMASGQDSGHDSVAFVSPAEIAKGAAIPREPRFLSGSQPDQQVLEALAEEGVTLVIDFRGEGEDRGLDERQAVEQLGMRYANLPVNVPDGVSMENAEALNRLIEENEGRVFMHCGSGNRAGAMVALREKLLGASDEEAIAAGKAAGLTRLENTVRERLSEE
ncbi:MAG: sulfur transferase domain-containing protein [Woeseiaceae bacterium]|nr:sulfur transferase domain-containing protein [Woeseiaceae bacterium]